jgi:quinohemoprotein ethanol dehydrogenase
LTFALDGKASLPETPPPDFSVQALDDPALKLDPPHIKRGASLYGLLTCAICHGSSLNAGGGAPDLQESKIALYRDSFKALLRGGSLVSGGMPLFDDLTDDEIESVYQYIRSAARDTIAGRAELTTPSTGP